MRRAAEDPALWRRLATATEAPPSLDGVAARHIAIFEGRTPASTALVAA
jgi:hypothetical protein